MPLSPGTRLGPYEILAPIGAGGMGEVYKARDTRLDRTIAIKVLPEHLSQKPQLRERFEREARAVSSLSHPHICPLYEIGSQDGVDFLVMEYLEGETLAHWLQKGPLALDQALCYAIEIAGALDHAHRHGVVHRDLKPGNIMLTKSGTKVLDFGLAKMRTAERSDLNQPTRTLTEEGLILGTLQYMAPEQLEGKEADVRSDVFAFGAVVYEMVTGKRAFEGASQASLIVAIMERETVPISALRQTTPAALERVVKKCLAKDPEKRWQSAQDLQDELIWLAAGDSHSGVPVPVVLQRNKREPIAWAITAAAVAGALAFVYLTRQVPDRPVTRFTLEPPVNVEAHDLSVSPDGRRISFADARGSGLWLRPVDSLAAQKLSGTEGAVAPFWSPDGRSLGFTGKGLMRLDLSSGKSSVPSIITPLRSVGCTWSPVGVILCSSGDELYSVPATGGASTPATRLNSARQQIAHRYPQFLPGGRHFIYWAWSASEENTGIYAGSLDPNERVPDGPLVRTWRKAQYAKPGYLLFLQGSQLVAQPFDAVKFRMAGEPESLHEDVGRDWVNAGRAMFSTSAGGALAYQEALPLPGARVIWRDRAGKQLRAIEAPPGSEMPSLDPGEKRIVVVARDENTLEDLWVIDLERGTTARLTASHGSDAGPIWSPDGQHIAFRSNRTGVYDLYVKNANGVGDDELLVKSLYQKWPSGWSPDGRFLAYGERDPNTGWDLWVLPLEGERKPFPLLNSEFNEGQGTFSPALDRQGRLWLAYNSDETGRLEIYLRPLLNGRPGGAKVLVSTGGGSSPRWRKDGRELFYFAGDKVMAVDVQLGATVEIGTPHALFENPPRALAGWAPFADGRQFLFTELASDPLPARINVVLNWQAELKR